MSYKLYFGNIMSRLDPQDITHLQG